MGLGGDSQNMTTLRAGIQLPFGTEAALRAVGRKVVVAASAHEARQSRKVCFSGGSEKDGAQMMLTVQNYCTFQIWVLSPDNHQAGPDLTVPVLAHAVRIESMGGIFASNYSVDFL